MPRDLPTRDLVVAAAAFAIGVAVMFEITGCGVIASLTRRPPAPAVPARSDGVEVALEPRGQRRVTPAEIRDLLKRHGVSPAVLDCGGSRTLLVLGDVHNALKRGDSYAAFFDALAEQVDVDAVFMEGVYARGEPPEPYLAYWTDVEKVKKGRDLYPHEREALCEDLRTRDPVAYFRLRKRFRVAGLELPETVARAVALSQAHDYLGVLYLGGDIDRRVERQVNRLARIAKSKLFPVRTYPLRMSPGLQQRLLDQAREARDAVTLRRRNAEFTARIDHELDRRKVAALIVGRAHVAPPEERQHHGTLLDGLRERKINAVVLDVFQVRRFLSRQDAAAELAKPSG